MRIRYQTLEFGDVDVHVRGLRDRLEYEDTDDVAAKAGIESSNWSLFGVVWDSSRVLAQLLSDYRIEGRRVLEVGCGLALASLVLNQRGEDITATDYHPAAEAFLEANVALNKGAAIPFRTADWHDETSGLGSFGLIVASDLLYERGNAELLCSFIERHALPACEVIIVDPGRGQLGRFGRLMATLGYACRVLPSMLPNGADAPVRARTHSFVRG